MSRPARPRPDPARPGGAEASFSKNAAAVLAGETDRLYNRDILYYPAVALKPIVIKG